MKSGRKSSLLRRRFLASVAAAPFLIAGAERTTRAVLAATPSCGEEKTPPQTAGPFFKPDTPRRTSLIDPGMVGEELLLTGRVLSTACEPIAGALLEFWHCDANGDYDNRGFRFRGHQFTDNDGVFSLRTLTPGLYPGRTRHIHVIVQAPNDRPLTTQLYFPGERLNRKDWIFDPQLLMDMAGQRGHFDFVLDFTA
jgi:protocatechuate 3,4-dioxygenase beta subunit